jgi:hypothetical protein
MFNTYMYKREDIDDNKKKQSWNVS